LIKLNRLADAQTVLDQAKSKGAKGEAFNQIEERLCGSNKNLQDPPISQLQPIIDLYTQGHLRQTIAEATQLQSKYQY
jgi:hypothetical protein